MDTARRLDEYLANTGNPIGPLHGLPVSLKDNFNLKGLDSTVGFVGHVGEPADHDSTLAELLQAAGAVFYVKTNVPTAMMIAESVNNLFGRTVNPLNRSLTSGGSSGGESALIAFNGSPMGVGTDIGGSLRIPAACTGIFSLRPSFGRFPTLKCRSGMTGQESVASVNGPLTRTLTDLEHYCRTVVGSEPWTQDPKCLPIPWRNVELGSKLRIAVMENDGMAMPTRPVSRALHIVSNKLKAAGHEVIEWSSEDQPKGQELLNRMFVADGGKSIRAAIKKSGEPWRPEMHAYEVAEELGGYQYWQLHSERVNYQKKYLDRWNAAAIDCILCPTTPYSSVENSKFKHVGYTGVYNVLDYSAMSFPTGIRVDASIDVAVDSKSYVPLSDLDKSIQEDCKRDPSSGPWFDHGLLTLCAPCV
jgi:amidase